MEPRPDLGGAAPLSFWGQLWSGLTRPSFPVLVTMTAVTTASWGALFLLVTPERMATWHPYFADEPKDSYVFVTGRVHELAVAPPAETPAVFILGTSGLRYGLSRPAYIEERLASALGRPARVSGLFTDDQSMLESYSILEELPDRFDGVVVLGISPQRFGRGLARREDDGGYEYRLGFRSGILERESEKIGAPLPRSVNHFLDNREYFLPRLAALARNVWSGRPEEFLPREDEQGGGTISEERWQRHQTAVRKHEIPNLRWQAPRTLAHLVRIAEDLESRGRVSVVLVEAPMSPRARQEIYGEVHAPYLDLVREFAREHGLEHWTLSSEARLEEADFFDWTHLNSADARRRYSDALADRVAGLLATDQVDIRRAPR